MEKKIVLPLRQNTLIYIHCSIDILVIVVIIYFLSLILVKVKATRTNNSYDPVAHAINTSSVYYITYCNIRHEYFQIKIDLKEKVIYFDSLKLNIEKKSIFHMLTYQTNNF